MCSECNNRYDLSMFQLREEGFNICKKCYKAYHEVKSKRKEETPADYNLDQFFKEPNEVDLPVEDIF